MSDTVTMHATIVLVDEDLIQAPADDELYMLDMAQGKYYYLNPTATREMRALPDIARTILRHHQAEMCRAVPGT